MTDTDETRPDREALLTLPDAEALRAHLDALNEAGVQTSAAGTDRLGNPFLIGLSGPYTETEDVIFGSPWDGEVDYNNGLRCDECNASNLHEISDLNYPVTVLALLPAPHPQGGTEALIGPPEPNNDDAMAWAESFVSHVQHYPAIPTDAGTMVSWFANAMQAMDSRVRDAYDRGQRDASALLAAAPAPTEGES